MKGLKEFVKAKKLNEDKVFVIHTKGGKVDYIEKGEYFAGPHGKMFVRDAGVDLKDWKGMDPKEAKEALIHFTRIDPKSIIIEGCKKVQEGWMPDSETITWLKDYLRDVKRGEGWVNIDKVVYDADIELNKDLSKNKKDLADYIKHIGGGSILKEATSNLREGFGELEVYTSFGPGLGVQIYPSRNGELTAHVGYVGSSSGNGIRKKELKTETELKAQDQIKVSDLKQIERVLKKHLDALDSDLEKTLKQLGYK